MNNHCVISEFDFTDILYQNCRHCAGKWYQQGCFGSYADVNFMDDGNHRTAIHRMMENGMIWSR